MDRDRSDVLIVGAGPTGLALALWLTKMGVRARIFDKTTAPGTTSRALAVQARTLELYRQLDLADEVVKRGHKTPAANLWVKGRNAARVPFEDVGAGVTPFPFLHIFPQDEHERLLIERLQDLGVAVERGVELLGFEDKGGFIAARLRGSDGTEEVCETAYIAGCDGARSSVRKGLGVDFPGGAYRQIFYVADVEAEGPAINGELHVDLDEADFLAVFPLAGEGRARLIGTVRDERADHPETLKFEDVSGRAVEHMKIKVRRLNWFSTYRVHHRVAERFRKGRAFLLGDAAHIHSPAGGQGMNTGIGDAINLAWKLAAVIAARAPDSLLDSYEAERIGFARRLVATTDRAFSFATAEGPVADILRTRVAPLLIPAVTSFEAAREYLFRTVAQLTLNYRGGPLSVGQAAAVHGGDRLPWAPSDGQDNYAAFANLNWQVHVYGAAASEIEAWCAAHHVPLHAFAWRSEYEAAGLARDALYLLRPDSYVALADSSRTVEALERYGAERRLNLGALIVGATRPGG
jgi:2-polyprenyl-6-methoxyphenol hydroxylase-like FAD-dependent oxidoreductase